MYRNDVVKRHAAAHGMTIAEAEKHVPPEQTMSCTACFRKHLASAICFAEEVINGHGAIKDQPFALDHRLDVASSLAGAESHARHLNHIHSKILRDLRHSLDARAWNIDLADVDQMRKLWMESLEGVPMMTDLLLPPTKASGSNTFNPPNHGKTAAGSVRKPCSSCGKRAENEKKNIGNMNHNSKSTSELHEPQSLYDVVIPLADTTAAAPDAPELRYAMRSMAKNLIGLGKIFIVSKTLPKWLDPKQVTHVPCADRAGWKDYNLIKKVLAAIDAGVSKKFIRSSDDQFLLQPTDAHLMQVFCESDAGNWTEEHWNAKCTDKTTWWKRLRNTVDALKAKGYSAYNFDSHHPCLIDAEKFKAVMAEFDILADKAPKHGYTINTLYFNTIGTPPRRPEGLHRISGELPGPGVRYWNVNKSTAWAAAEKYLKTIFPYPASWEIQLDILPSISTDQILSKNLICTLTSSKFLIGTAALLESLKQHNSEYSGDVGIIDINLNDNERLALQKIYENIRFFAAPVKEFSDIIDPVFRGAKTNRFYSLEIFRIGKNYNKVLFIDSDIIINGKITDTFEQCPGNQLAAVKDQNDEANTGFFIVTNSICNSLKWEKITDTIKKQRGPRTDQAVVNSLFGDNYYKLPRSCNQIYRHELIRGHKYHPASKNVLAAHFTGHTKAWHNPANDEWTRLYDSYIHAARMTAGPELADNFVYFTNTSLRKRDWKLIREYLLQLKKTLQVCRAVEIGAGLVSTALLDVWCDYVASFEDNPVWSNRIENFVSNHTDIVQYNYPDFPFAPAADFCLIDGPQGKSSNWRLEAMRWASQHYTRIAIHDINRSGDNTNMQTIFTSDRWTEISRSTHLVILEAKSLDKTISPVLEKFEKDFLKSTGSNTLVAANH